MKEIDLDRSEYAVTQEVGGVEETEEAIPDGHVGRAVIAIVFAAMLSVGLSQLRHPAPAEIGSAAWWQQNR